MCQKHEGEQAYMFNSERRERNKKINAHNSGEHILTPEEIRDIKIQQFMARDAGY